MRPKILWIPHTDWDHCTAQRPQLLIEGLIDRFDIHVVTWAFRPSGDRSGWRFYLNPWNHLRALQDYPSVGTSPTVHQVRVPLPVIQGILRDYPPDWTLTIAQQLFQSSIRKLHRKWQYDAVVASASHHFTGYPPAIPGVPCIFDYVDTSPPNVEQHYVHLANRIITVSHYLRDRVLKFHGRESRVIPNGLFLNRIRSGDAAKARKRWGLVGKKVISLIGMTCSPRLYFLEAIASLLPEFPDIVFVGAGGGRMADSIDRKCQALGIPAVMTGWVEPVEVCDLFAATDIGLYPGDDNAYFDGACPLKVLEYLGAGAWLVVNRSAELVRLGFSSLIVKPASAKDFADGLRQALTLPRPGAPELQTYDWGNLGRAFGDEIEGMLAGERDRRTTD